MPIIRRQKNEPYSAQQMYQLVNDVDAYSEFLPWCKGSRVISESEESMEATILMAKGPLNRSFTTRNRLVSGRSIELNLVDGPFKHLNGLWEFEDRPEGGSTVKLMVDFDFSFGPARLILTPIFESIASSLVSAFSQRAREIYG